LNVVFIESIPFVYVIIYTLAIFHLGENIMFQFFNFLRGTSRLWCWCWKHFWVWHFLRTLQNDSSFALY